VLALFVGLGIWQMQRLLWKEAILSEINSKITAVPVLLPDTLTPEEHKYLSVEVAGDFTGQELQVLVSTKSQGAGYRVISEFVTQDDRRIMIDRGFVPLDRKEEDRKARHIKVNGNLHWPDEIDGFTPEPDTVKNIWFARDVPAMAAALGTEHILIVAQVSSKTIPDVQPVPITTAGIPNDHLEYAVTWFLLAATWAGMTAYLLWRITQRNV